MLEIGRLRLVIASRVNLVSLRGCRKVNILLKLLYIFLRGSQPSLLPLILPMELEKLPFLRWIQHSGGSVDRSFVHKLIVLIEFAVAIVKRNFHIFASGGGSWVIGSTLGGINIMFILLYSL